MDRISDMPRTIDEHGVGLGCKTLPEVMEKLKKEGAKQGRRRKASGGEIRGYAYVVSSLICWFLSDEIDRDERNRIIDSGREIFDGLLAMDGDPDVPEDVFVAPKLGPEGLRAQSRAKSNPKTKRHTKGA